VHLIQSIYQFFSCHENVNKTNKNRNDNGNKYENINENGSGSKNQIENENERYRKLTSRMILLLCTALITKKDFIVDHDKSDYSFSEKFLVSRIFLKTVKNMFQHLKSVNEDKAVRGSFNNEISYQAKENNHSLSDDMEHLGNNYQNDKSNIENDEIASNNSYVAENNLDLLLEYQNFLSTMIPDLGIILLNKTDQIGANNDAGISHQNNGSNSNYHELYSNQQNRRKSNSNNSANNHDNNNSNDDDVDDDTSSDENYMGDDSENGTDNDSTNITDNGCKTEERMFFVLLEASVFTAGVIRHHSSDESVRKQKSNFDIIENVSDELRTVGSFTVICQKRIIQNTEKVKNEIISKLVGVKANEIISKFIHKLSEIVVQLVVIIRNYSIDNYGKAQLINTKIVGLLCSLLKPFKSYPVLVLNCVRVTAKLSLQDNFRAQINSKTAQIKCLIDVLVQEGSICLGIMNGTSEANSINPHDHRNNSISSNGNTENHGNYSNGIGNSNTDSSSWPYWYTWPLISRIAFTLGNLTTSNSLNRCGDRSENRSLLAYYCMFICDVFFLLSYFHLYLLYVPFHLLHLHPHLRLFHSLKYD
jgi:hypothetical protein